MARSYSAKWGRFTTVDPAHVGGNLFDPQSWNAYGYARNNPLRFVDPLGTEYVINWKNNGDWSTSVVDDDIWEAQLGDVGSGFAISGNNIVAWVNGRPQFAGFFEWRPDQPRTFNALVQTAGDRAAKDTADGVIAMGKNALFSAGMGLVRWGSESAILALEARAGAATAAARAGKQIAGALKQIAQGTTRGKRFGNYEGRLPKQPLGYYTEHTVTTLGVPGRGAQRLVVGRGGEVYFTPDHYGTFVRIK